jgi:hypothetical protein
VACASIFSICLDEVSPARTLSLEKLALGGLSRHAARAMRPRPKERRKIPDRRARDDRRGLPPRPEGRRHGGGRRKGDPVEA